MFKPAEIQIVRGVGGAPRGLRAHQKALRKRERIRRPRCSPRQACKQGKETPTPPKVARRRGPTAEPPNNKSSAKVTRDARKKLSANVTRDATCPAKDRRAQTTLLHPTSKGANDSKATRMAESQERKKSGGSEPRKASPSKAGKASKLKKKMLADYALQRVVSISRGPRGWGSSD